MIFPQGQLIDFLQEELAIPTESIGMALRHAPQDQSQLPLVLWQYGLIDLAQLEQIWDWLEMA